MRQLTTSLVLIIAIALVTYSCQSEEKPKPESKDRKDRGGGIAGLLQGAKWTMAGDELRTSLQEYIKETYPGWEIKGEMIQFEKDGFYVVVVDIGADKQRQSVTVASRIFRKADGSYYWKCEPFTPEIKSIQELIETADKAELGR